MNIFMLTQKQWNSRKNIDCSIVHYWPSVLMALGKLRLSPFNEFSEPKNKHNLSARNKLYDL